MNVVSGVDLLGAAAGIINLLKTYNISKGKQYIITGLNCTFFQSGIQGGVWELSLPPWIFNYCVSQKINIFILILKLSTKYSEFYQQIKA